MSTFTDEGINLLRRFSNDDSEKNALWGSAFKKMVYNCGTGIIELDDISMRLLLEDGFCKATSDFITKARAFDTRFKTDDILQALRNVWIMNCIQKLMGFGAETTPSILSYSMLYPYTDNYLDNTQISAEKKKHINHRFTQRLADEKPEAETELECKLFKLVDMIEQQYPPVNVIPWYI